jgi:hypothetical protein
VYGQQAERVRLTRRLRRQEEEVIVPRGPGAAY